jgi:hypothetical protein
MKYIGYIPGWRAKLSRNIRHTRHRTVESQPAISVNELHRRRAFTERWVSFPNYGFICPAVSRLRACRRQIEIYSYCDETRGQSVPILWTYCRIGARGGFRPWFRCKCGRRVGKLYNAGPVFACRKCCNLIYECQLKSAKGRLHRAASKVRLQLLWFERRSAFKEEAHGSAYAAGA